VASGWEKGIVEKNVQDSRRRVWIEAKTQVFSSFAELNSWLDARCRSLWLKLEHPDYKGVTLADALEQVHIRTHHEHLFLSIVNTDSYRT
jgi:hypothetical protein